MTDKYLRLAARIAGNFFTGFATSFLALYVTAGGPSNIETAALVGLVQGLLAAAIELRNFGNYDEPGRKKGSFFLVT